MMTRHPESHLDHGLTQPMIDYIFDQCADLNGFAIRTLELPPEMGMLLCKLHGPAVGEPPVEESEVTYEVRPNRKCASRVCSRPDALTRQVTVISGPEGDEPCILFTAFAGPQAARELGDTDLLFASEQDRRDAVEFWKTHALSK